MSFGDGDLHVLVAQLKTENARMKQRNGELRALVRDMYSEWCATVDDYYAQAIDGYYERMAALGIEVGE